MTQKNRLVTTKKEFEGSKLYTIHARLNTFNSWHHAEDLLQKKLFELMEWNHHQMMVVSCDYPSKVELEVLQVTTNSEQRYINEHPELNWQWKLKDFELEEEEEEEEELNTAEKRYAIN